MLKIGIVNYGMGNIGSVFNAIEFLGQTPVILDTPAALYNGSLVKTEI